MVIFHNFAVQRLMLFLVTCLIRIECTYADGATKTDPSESKNTELISECALTEKKNEVNAFKNFVNEAVLNFLREFESRHQVTVLADCQLERVISFESGITALYGTLFLKFSFQKDGHTFRSSFFVKVPQLGALYDIGKELLYYDKEKYMYSQILPQMYKSWPYEKISFEFYASTDTGILMLENVSESNFHPMLGMRASFRHCLVVLHSIAQFHALSITQLGEFSIHMLDALTVKDRSRFFSFSDTMVQKFRTLVFPSLTPKMKEVFLKMIADPHSAFNSVFSPNENGFNVILLGDPNWTNVVFQNDDQNLVMKCKFSDFHNSRRGSPVIDLVNYLMTSVEFEVFEKHGSLLEFFRFYLQKFSQILETLTSDHQRYQYSMEALLSDVRKYALHFAYRLIFIVPRHWISAAILDKPSASLFQKNAVYIRLFASKQYISFVKNWMNVFLEL